MPMGRMWLANKPKAQQYTRTPVVVYPKARYGVAKRRYKRRRAWTTLPVISPKTTTVRLRYSIPYSLDLTSTVGAIGENVFRANSCYDPDFSGVGLQPRGFDQYMALYDHFCVRASRIIINFQYLQPSTTANSGLCALILNDRTTPFANYTDVSESRYRVRRPINSQTPVSLALKFNAKRFFGRWGGNILNDKELSGTATANPFEDAAFHVTFHTLQNTTQTVYATGYIDYIVTFHEPKQPPLS